MADFLKSTPGGCEVREISLAGLEHITRADDGLRKDGMVVEVIARQLCSKLKSVGFQVSWDLEGRDAVCRFLTDDFLPIEEAQDYTGIFPDAGAGTESDGPESWPIYKARNLGPIRHNIAAAIAEAMTQGMGL
jgi:hypothetical protein